MDIIPPTDRWDIVEARIWYQVDIRWYQVDIRWYKVDIRRYQVVGRIRVGTQASSGI